MNEQACMASHVHPFFIFTWYSNNPDYRKKKIFEKCVASKERKNCKTTTTTTFTCEAFKWCLLFFQCLFSSFHSDLMALLLYCKIIFSSTFYSSEGVDSQLLFGLLSVDIVEEKKVFPPFLWQIIMQIVAAVAFQSVFYPLLSLSLHHRKSPHCCKKKFMTFRGAI